MNCDVHGHVLRSYNLPVLYSYCNSFFIRDVHEEFGLINVHFIDILPAISFRTVTEKSVSVINRTTTFREFLRSYNLPVLYLYCNSFFIRDVHEEFGLINVHLFDIFRLGKSGKSRQFFSVWEWYPLSRVQSQLSISCPPS